MSRRSADVLRLMVILTAAPGGASAHDYTAGGLRILHPWITPAAQGAPTTAVYLTIVNTGKASDWLIAVDVPDAASADIHRTTMEGGIMRMRRLDDGLALPAGATVRLAPGGDHVMVMGLIHALKPGDHTPAVLTFAHAGKVKVTLDVERFTDAMNMH
jgi:copper(I)-binding protein